MKLHLPKSILAAVLAVLASLAQAETRTYTGNDNKNIKTSGYDTIIFQMSGGSTNNYFSSDQNIAGSTDAAIKIQDDTTTTDQVEGLIINNGYAENVQIFTGALSGDGLLQKTGNGDPNTIVFAGNTSGFTGSIDLSSDRTFTLVFGGNSTAVSAAETSAEKGIIGSGNITYNSSDKNNAGTSLLQTLRFNYAASDNKPVYITNSIKDTGKGTSKLELSGGADYTLTQEVTVDELSISAGVATFSQNLSVGSISGGGDIALADGCTLTVGRTTGTIAADITGAVSLIKSDSTSTTLSGNNSFTGGTFVQAGTLIVDSAAALAGDVTVDTGATLQFNANPTAACDITLNGKLSLTWINNDSFSSQLSIKDATFYSSTGGTESANDGYARWDNFFNGNIYLGETGSVSTKNLSIVNNKLTYSKSDTFYVRSEDFKISESTDTSATTFHVTENAGLDINGKALVSKTVQLDAGATLTNTGIAVGVGLQQIQDITLNGNASVIATEGKEFGILGYRWGSTTMHLNEQILTKEGDGTFFLVNTTVSGGGKIAVAEGTLQIGCYNNSGTAINSETTEFAIADKARLHLAYSSGLSAAGISGAGSITKTGNISTTLTLAGSGEYTFSGSIAEQIAINKTGSGHQLLTGSNTISSLTMTAGTLTLGSDGAEITLSTGTVTNGGTVNLAGNFTISGALSDYEFASSAGVEYSVAGTLNGFKTTRGDSYYLFKGGSGSVAEGMNPASINLSSASQLSNSATLSATEGGIVFTFGGSNTTNDFYVQEGTVKQSTLLNDESYGVTAATGYIVTSGGTLELAQSNSGTIQLNGGTLQLGNNLQQSDMNLRIQSGAVELNGKQLTLSTGDQTSLLQSLTGSGTLVVNGETTLMGSTSSASPISLNTTATLVITSGSQFNLGTDHSSQANLYATLGNISNVQLQGGTLRYNTGSSTINRVETVAGYTGSHFYIRDTNNVSDIVTISMLHLNSDLSIDSEWDAKVEISLLTGSGNLSLGGRNTAKDTAADGHIINTTVGAGYTGTISLADANTLHAGFTLEEQATATIQAVTNQSLTKTQLEVTLRDNSRLNISGTSGKTVELDTITVAEDATASLSAAEGVLLSVREISGGHLSIGAEVGSVSLTGGTITNNASLSLYGNITISGELDSYESYGSGNLIGYSMNDGTANGFKLVAGKQYYLSMGGSNSLATNTAALNINTTESLTGDTAYLSVVEATEEKQAGIVFSLDPTYSAEFYVQEGRVDQSSLLADETCGVTATTHYIINGGTLSLSQNVGTNLLTYESGSVELQSGSTLSINTAAESNAALLMNSSGAGSVQVSQNIALADDYTANISGELNISQATVAQGKANLESFSGIRLSNGATLSYSKLEHSYANLTIDSGTQNLTFTAAGDETGAATLSIGKLSGSGELHLAATDKLTLSLEDTQDFEGTLLMNSNHISLNLAENAGITAWYQETAASELNLLNVGAGNTIGMRVVTGSLTSGSIAANLELQNHSGGAALWLNNSDENGEIILAGSISGGGNMGLAAADKSISMSISGDTSDWSGNIQFNGNEHRLTFTENAVSIRNSKIFTSKGGTGHVELRHASAATVAAKLEGELHVTVSNSSEEGTSFTNSVDISSLSVEADSRVAVTHYTVSVDAVDNAGNLSFTGIQSLNLTDLSLADGSVLSVGSGVAAVAAESADTFTGVTVSGTAVLEGGSTINGSLDLSEAASIELNNMDEAIDINGDLILVLGENVTVSGNYTEMLENLVAGQSLDIFRVSGSITLNGLELTDGYSEDAGSLIAAIEQGRYSLGYRASATGDGGTLYLSTASSPAVPEPTTATLSLLALAAMAARRRRK